MLPAEEDEEEEEERGVDWYHSFTNLSFWRGEKDFDVFVVKIFSLSLVAISESFLYKLCNLEKFMKGFPRESLAYQSNEGYTSFGNRTESTEQKTNTKSVSQETA